MFHVLTFAVLQILRAGLCLAAGVSVHDSGRKFAVLIFKSEVSGFRVLNVGEEY